MSDLISRSELLESFRKSYCGHLGMENSDGMITFRSICRIINEQPTAYDIDKVIRQLNLESVGSSIQMSLGLLKAIKIVKQGCISDDVCEYKIKDEVIYASCNNKSIASAFCWFNECGDYNYCPYCGKKIKTVEVK